MSIYDEYGETLTDILFRVGKLKNPEGEYPLFAARTKAELAMRKKQEVRIFDANDALVFHTKDGEILRGKDFWKELERKRYV